MSGTIRAAVARMRQDPDEHVRALADWLDDELVRWDQRKQGAADGPGRPSEPGSRRAADWHSPYALKVAQEYLDRPNSARG